MKLVTKQIFIGDITNDMVVNEFNAITHDPELQKEEIEKCKASPYYFYTHYFIINGKPATTILTEEEFNTEFNKLKLLNNGL